MQPNLYRIYWRDISPTGGNANKSNILKKYDWSFFNQKNCAHSPVDLVPVTHSFEFEVAWPGLLAGLGYEHGTSSSNDESKKSEYKMGFSLDYTTGLPYLPGSTVKGWLRHFFPGRYSDSVNETDKREEVALSIASTLKELGINYNNLTELEDAIFCGIYPKHFHADPSTFRQDVFFDAFPLSASGTSTLFAEEFITPHSDPLNDPTPLRLLKIAPGVKIKFQFRLSNFVISANDKALLFKHLISTYGIGAKTATGFGQFKNADWPEPTKRTSSSGHELPLPHSDRWYAELNKSFKKLSNDFDDNNDEQKGDEDHEPLDNQPLPDPYRGNDGVITEIDPKKVVGTVELHVKASLLKVDNKVGYFSIQIKGQNPWKGQLTGIIVSKNDMGKQINIKVSVIKDSNGNLIISVP